MTNDQSFGVAQDKCQMTNEGRISRIIDANINRAVEGIRVIEEMARFILEDKKLTNELKAIRANVRRVIPAIRERDSEGDVGRESYTANEAKRITLLDVFSANIKRAQEALRALEEFSKLLNPQYGQKFKAARFKLYDLEKRLYYPISRKMKLDFSLYVITDPMRDHLAVAKQAIAGGAKAFQLRDKIASKKQLLIWAKKIRQLAKKSGVTFIVNDYADIAKESGADGVHVGQDEKSIAKVRKVVGEDKIIGVSVENVRQAKKAQKSGADYVAVGPIFKTPIKAELKPVGLNVLRQVVKSVKIPVVAIGGIDALNISKIYQTGCKRAAVIRAVLEQRNIQKAIKTLLSA
jgi:thiamine-phosphate pyrophosphorylase